MPAFHKLQQASEWMERKHRRSESGDPGDGDHPAEAEDPPVAKLGVVNPISEPAEVQALAEKTAQEEITDQALQFLREVKAVGKREFDVAARFIGKYVDGRMSIEKLDRLLAREWKVDHGDLLAKFRSFVSSLPTHCSTGSPSSAAPSSPSPSDRPSPSTFRHLCPPKRKRTVVVRVGRRHPRKPQAASAEEETPREPREPQRRDHSSSQATRARLRHKEREAIRMRMREEAELAEQERQRVEERRQEDEERRQLDVFEEWHKVRLQADLDTTADSGMRIEKPGRDSKFWYPWLNEGGAQVQGPGSSSKSTRQVPKLQWCPLHNVWEVRM